MQLLSKVCYKHGVETSDGHLCLSLLSDFANYHTEWSESTQAWTAAYRLRDVLLNLYSLLSDEEEHDKSEREVIQHSAFSARPCTCGHCGELEADWLPQRAWKEDEGMSEENAAADADDDVPAESQATVDGAVSKIEQETILNNMACYLTLVTGTEVVERGSDEIMGFGLTAEYHADDRLKVLTTPCEYMSHTAWMSHDNHVSIYKKRLDFFFPLYICEEHFERSLPVLLHSLRKIIKKPSKHQAHDTGLLAANDLNVKDVHHVLATILCYTIVSTMEARIRGSEGVQLSTLLIQGFSQLWRLTWALCNRDPALQQSFSERVHLFVENPNKRSKTYERNLGHLMACIPFSDCTWSECAKPIVTE